MSATVDIKRVLCVVMAMATLAVVLAVPHAQAATDCSTAGTDPTAAQYCPPTEPVTEEKEKCDESTQGSSPISGSNSGSENCSETADVSTGSPSGTEPAASSGSLPFTGSDVLALIAVAGAFIAVGLALQRLSRTNVDPH